MSFQPSPNPLASATVLTGQPCFVRVTGTRDTRFVEFEFAIGDPELSVEEKKRIASEAALAAAK